MWSSRLVAGEKSRAIVIGPLDLQNGHWNINMVIVELISVAQSRSETSGLRYSEISFWLPIVVISIVEMGVDFATSGLEIDEFPYV